MAAVRAGAKKVLLVVDVQNGVLAGAWERERVVANIKTAVNKARVQGAPLIWVQHVDEELVYGSTAWQIVPALQPAAGETLVEKRFNSSFEETSLDDLLAELGAAHIVLAGAATNWCVRATAYAALDRGYDLTLLKDAHTTESMAFEDGVNVEAAVIIRELNNAMTWLSYPRRTTSTALVANVDFGPADDSS